MSAELPRLPRYIGKKSHWIKGWDNNNESPESAEGFYSIFERRARDQGIDLTKNVKVLELGSGNAMLLEYAKSQGVDIVGVEVEPRGKREFPQVIARIEQLPFPDETFEVVISASIFDHSEYEQDQDLMMKDVARVLKHGGIYIGAEYLNKIPEIPGLVCVDKDRRVFKKS